MKKIIPILWVAIAIIFVTACTKSTNINTNTSQATTINYNQLTAKTWLNTPTPLINYAAGFRNQLYYVDTVTIIDTFRLVFHADSTWKYEDIVTEKWKQGTIPVQYPNGNYLPKFGFSLIGNYHINQSDSILITQPTNFPIPVNPLTIKVLLLTSDSLQLSQGPDSSPSPQRFYAVP